MRAEEPILIGGESDVLEGVLPTLARQLTPQARQEVYFD